MSKVPRKPGNLSLVSGTYIQVTEKTDSRKLSPDPHTQALAGTGPHTHHIHTYQIINQFKFTKELPEPDTNLSRTPVCRTILSFTCMPDSVKKRGLLHDKCPGCRDDSGVKNTTTTNTPPPKKEREISLPDIPHPRVTLVSLREAIKIGLKLTFLICQ